MDSVRSALTKVNLPADILTDHSFRIGAATTAASADIYDSSIQSLGDWKNNAYLVFIRTKPHKLAKISSTMSLCKF